VFAFHLSTLFIALTLAISGCSKDDEKDNKAHLKYIPADSPYVFVSLEPAPEELNKKIAESYESIIDVYYSIASETYQGYIDRAKAAADPASKADYDDDIWDNKWVSAIRQEFGDDFSFGALSKFGITNQSLYALYGNGVMPVLRISLSDNKLFTSAIERIEKNANDEIDEITVDGMRVWSISDNADENVELILAVSDEDLIITFSPAGTRKNTLEKLLGKQLPEKSLADSKSLDKLMQDKKYLPYSVGYFDHADK